MQHIVLLLEWFTNPDHVPLYAAQQQGFFRQEGLELSVLLPSHPDEPLKLAAAGKVDFALNYQPAVILARSQGWPVISIGVLIEHTLDTIMFLRASGIQTPRDLKGKRIGYAVAPFDQAMFEAVAERAGLRREDYQLVPVGFEFTLALLSGQVEAVMGAFKNYEKIEAEVAGQEVGIFELAENGVPDFYQLIFIAHEDLATKQPELARRFVRAMAQGLEFTQQRPQEALEAYFAANPSLRNELNRRAFEATKPYYAHTQVQSELKWAQFQDFMLQRGLIKRKSPLDKLFTKGQP